ncbi:MAG TPA: response regulator, partial [Kofleriaceae bacterium]
RAAARPVGNPITHVVVSYLDITREVATERARAETEQRLRRAQRLEAIGSLAGGIAHDFNNLIFSIKLLANDVANGPAPLEPKVRQAMADIDEVTDRSAALTRSLLGFARRSKHRSMSVNLNDVVTSMTELLGRTLAGVELRFDLEASERGAVVGDQAQLEQVVMNLVLHARDAVHAQGRIVVRTLDREDGQARQVVLEVADDSAGISERVVDRAAEPYATTHNTGGEADAGLATVFGIAESHGGKVEVDTGLDGAGTALRLVLPAAPRSAARARSAAVDLPRGSGGVLVVDDDAMVRKVVSGSLTSLGYTPIEAVSGSNAIEIYRQRHAEIRAVMLDMMMRGLAGRATYLGLREINPAVAVLLMSGHTLNEQVQEILDLGVRAFVSKPYSIAQLAVAMAELLRR